MQPIFITGIGTGIGKTIISAIVTEALHADYWKPVQAGFDDGTDSLFISKLITNNTTVIHEEAYQLRLAASPHISAREENTTINLERIKTVYDKLDCKNSNLIIEGAGGIMVPLNDTEFMLDLVKRLQAKVILVSRNYLGSINHSLLTAQVCKQHNIDVLGWIFNDQYMQYEEEIVQWSGYKKICSVPFTNNPNKNFVQKEAAKIVASLQEVL